MELLQGRLVPLSSPDKTRATKRMFLNGMRLIMTLVFLHIAWLFGTYIGLLVLEYTHG